MQLLQTYARLAELEINAGERPKAGDVALAEDTGERVRGWAEGEDEREQAREELVGELAAAMESRGCDPTPIREAMGDERAGGLSATPNSYAVARDVLST